MTTSIPPEKEIILRQFPDATIANDLKADRVPKRELSGPSTNLKVNHIAKNRNTHAKRQREQEKRQRADDKRRKREDKINDPRPHETSPDTRPDLNSPLHFREIDGNF